MHHADPVAAKVDCPSIDGVRAVRSELWYSSPRQIEGRQPNCLTWRSATGDARESMDDQDANDTSSHFPQRIREPAMPIRPECLRNFQQNCSTDHQQTDHDWVSWVGGTEKAAEQSKRADMLESSNIYRPGQSRPSVYRRDRCINDKCKACPSSHGSDCINHPRSIARPTRLYQWAQQNDRTKVAWREHPMARSVACEDRCQGRSEIGNRPEIFGRHRPKSNHARKPPYSGGGTKAAI